MMWEGQVFPSVMCDGDQLPEALPSQPGLLPHLHPDHESRYPRAAVRHQQYDRDPPEDTALEQRGITLGKEPQRFKAIAKRDDDGHRTTEASNA